MIKKMIKKKESKDMDMIFNTRFTHQVIGSLKQHNCYRYMQKAVQRAK